MSENFRRGDYVQTWFDTGAMGCTLLYGVVVASGPKSFTVLWESGLRNRLRQDAASVSMAADEIEAARAVAKVRP